MAIPQTSDYKPQLNDKELVARFGIAQDRPPMADELMTQAKIRGDIALIAVYLNANVEDSREKSLALTHLEDALMWAGKAIFKA